MKQEPAESMCNLRRQSFSGSICDKLSNPIIFRERTTMPRGTQPNNGIGNGQHTKEQHHQQQGQIEVIGFGCSKL